MAQKTVEINPTWSGILGTLLMLLESGKTEGRNVAKEELVKMAKCADLYNEMVKEGEEKEK